MIFIKIVFKLLMDFGLLDEVDYAKLFEDAEKWWIEIRIDNEKDVVKDWKYKFKKAMSIWWVAVLVCIVYFPLKRYLQDYVSDEVVDDLQEDE